MNFRHVFMKYHMDKIEDKNEFEEKLDKAISGLE